MGAYTISKTVRYALRHFHVPLVKEEKNQAKTPVTLTTETHMAGKRRQAWRNLMVAAVLMTGSPANANDRAVYAAYCEQVSLELYNKFSAIPPSLIPAFDADLHAAIVKEHNEILAQITREYHRFKDYAHAALINDSKGL